MLTSGSFGPACQATTLTCPPCPCDQQPPWTLGCFTARIPARSPSSASRDWPSDPSVQHWNKYCDLTSDSLLPGRGLPTSLLSLLQVCRMPHDTTRVPCGIGAAFCPGAAPPWSDMSRGWGSAQGLSILPPKKMQHLVGREKALRRRLVGAGEPGHAGI